MRVRIRTTPGGLFIRLLIVFFLGVLTVMWVDHQGGLNLSTPNLLQSPTSSAPTAAPLDVAPQPLVVAATVAPTAKPTATLPPGWIDFLGIKIPPEGWNDTHH